MSVQERGEAVVGERTAYRDPKVPRRVLPLAHQSLRLNLLPGERVLGMFACTRLRRSITMLVVTDRRLLTLGDEHVGMPLVDELPRDEVRVVTIEREKVFSTGVVTAHTVHGEVGLGTLTYGKETFNRLEEVLADSSAGALPVIPTQVPGGRPSERLEDDVPGRPPRPPAVPTHPLVVHLTALADLHERGALSDEEFAAAKARLLADPHGAGGRA